MSNDNNNQNTTTTTTTITEVYLSYNDAPGGGGETYLTNRTNNYSNSNNHKMMYIELGDVLLFDIVQDVCDGAYRAVPTKHRLPHHDIQHSIETKSDTTTGTVPTVRNTNIDDVVTTTTATTTTTDLVPDHVEDPSIVPAVRLIQLSLAGRAEGTITAIKDTYGFIQYAERPIDVHFKFSHILPDHIQNDIRYYMSRGNASFGTATTTSETLSLEVGTQVQFDLSVPATSNKSTTATSSSGNHHHNRSKVDAENMKGQRILFLPSNTFTTSVRLSDTVRGIITQQDAQQPYCGAIKIHWDDSICSTANLLKQRHPLIVKMLETYLEQVSKSASPALTTSSTVAANRIIVPPVEYHDIQSIKEVNTILELIEIIGRGQLTHSFIPQSKKNESNNYGRLVVKLKDDQVLPENQVDAVSVKPKSNTADELEPQRQKEAEVVTTKIVRYDRKSYNNEYRNDVPASIDDVVECRVVLCRRTGVLRVENMKVVERCSIDVSEMEVLASDVNGTIKEMMTNFGFLTLLDEKFNSKKNEVVIFLLNDVQANGSDKPQFRKGDPVRFNIRSARNGKRLAVNVSHRLKKSNKNTNQDNDKNICLGVILLEPSLTTLKNTPIRKASSNASTEKTSRWDTGDDNRSKSSSEDIFTDLGCIVLTSDPGSVIARKIQEENSGEVDSRSTSHGDCVPPTDIETSLSSPNEAGSTSGLYQHLRYKASSLSMYQPGAMMTDVAKSLTPKRGDLVSFVKIKNMPNPNSTNHTDVVIREIRLMTKGAASLIRGKLEWLSDNECGNTVDDRRARFVCDDDPQTTYDIRASEIVSCDPLLIKDQELVEGILYEGRLFGVVRITDLYIESKYSGANNKERPKLNLTVKKDLGGKIVAQSMMAKGPDGTNGFAPGWTQRISRFLTVAETISELKIDAPEFTPMRLT
jgi:hypothetical protein